MHVQDGVLISKRRGRPVIRHGQFVPPDVDQVLVNALFGVRKLEVAEVAQHAQRHQRVVLVLDFDVQDEILIPDLIMHAGHQIGTALFHPLLFGVQQFHRPGIHLKTQQQVGNVGSQMAQHGFADYVFVSHAGSIAVHTRHTQRRFSARHRYLSQKNGSRVGEQGNPSLAVFLLFRSGLRRNHHHQQR